MMSAATQLVDRYREFNDRRAAPYVKGAVGFGVLASVPTLLTSTPLGSVFGFEIMVVTLLFAYAAQCWNIMSGYTGYFSFGHAAFFGTGAYVTQKLLVDFQVNPWLGMLVGGLIAAAIGVFIGGLTFTYEVEGHYFALATLAVAVLLQALVRNMHEFNGAKGFYKPFADTYASGAGLIAFQFTSQPPYYYLMLGFLVGVTVISYAIKNSQVGLYLFAIRENEDAAQSLGIPVYRYKLLAVGLSAMLTAFAGTFWSMYFLHIAPETVFGVSMNVEIILPAVFGGMGTVAGPILGAFFVLPLSEIIRQSFGNIIALNRVVYGLAVILIVLYSPRGIMSWPDRVRDLRNWLHARRGGATTDEDGA